VGEDAALEKSVELVFDELGQRRAGLRLDLGREGVEVLLDKLIQRRVFGAPTFVVDRVRRWWALNRLAHNRSALSLP
jgi:2-hydroxychromene-2-carboxylate isomerase